MTDLHTAAKLALEALEYVYEGANNQGPHTGISWRCASNKVEPVITPLREALANEALDKKAENAREVGLDYEPAQQEKVDWEAVAADQALTIALLKVQLEGLPGKEQLPWFKDEIPAAYMYDRARYGPTDLRGQQWLPELSRLKPYTGNGMVRGLTPLYTRPQAREPEQPAQQEPVAWRELCRRLYVELFHCDRQMMATRDEDGEPMWQQGVTVRDVLADAKAALDAAEDDCHRSLAHPQARGPEHKEELQRLRALVRAQQITIDKLEVREPEQPVQQEPVALLPKVDVCMRAEAHGIDASTPGLYGFYVDCMSSSQQPAQEPVAWVCNGTHGHHDIDFLEEDVDSLAVGTQLYTRPQAREPLSNGEIYTAYITATNQTLRAQDERLAFAFARAVEAAHGIKGDT